MAVEATTGSAVCPQCGTVFEIPFKSGRKPEYCSQRCRKLTNNAKVRERRKQGVFVGRVPKRAMPATPCEFCAKPTTRPRFCSQRCAGNKRDREISGFTPEARNCRECGAGFVCAEPRNFYCSTRCSRRVNNRRSSAHRRARLRQAERERFDPVEVLERDGWRCHLCGVKTPKRLRGTTDPRAPEMDHVVPLAAGGEHSLRNAACSCRACNMAKGAKPLGQPRLVA